MSCDLIISFMTAVYYHTSSVACVNSNLMMIYNIMFLADSTASKPNYLYI